MKTYAKFEADLYQEISIYAEITEEVDLSRSISYVTRITIRQHDGLLCLPPMYNRGKLNARKCAKEKIEKIAYAIWEREAQILEEVYE